MRDLDRQELIRQLTHEMTRNGAGAAPDVTSQVAVLVAAAVLADSSDDLLVDALRLATSTTDRQFVAIAVTYLAGDHDRVVALAGDHLLDHPSRPVLAWITAQSRSAAPNPGDPDHA